MLTLEASLAENLSKQFTSIEMYLLTRKPEEVLEKLSYSFNHRYHGSEEERPYEKKPQLKKPRPLH